MKVVFLDVDGVLNSQAFWMKRMALKAEGKMPKSIFYAEREKRFENIDLSQFIDGVCVERVNRLLKESGAKVVMSSTWRTSHAASTRQLVKRMGIRPYSRLIGITPHLDRKHGELYLATTRGAEIQAWLEWCRGPEMEPVEAFVILDDDDDLGALSHRLVKTDNAVGLTDADVDRVLALLQKAGWQ